MKLCDIHNIKYTKTCIECNREAQRKYQKKLRQQLQEILNEYKLSKGCAKCGYKDNVFALEFDHIIAVKPNGKKRTGPKYKKQARELMSDSNVQVLCANCHKIKTRENNDHKPRT